MGEDDVLLRVSSDFKGDHEMREGTYLGDIEVTG